MLALIAGVTLDSAWQMPPQTVTAKAIMMVDLRM